MNIETVNELIQSLESAGELSIREQKFLKLAKAFKQLAAENVQIKAMNDCLSEELRGYESDGAFEGPKMHLLWWQVETPATDAFLAGIKADGVEWIEGNEPAEFGRYWVRYETDVGPQYCSAKWMEHNFCASSDTNIHKIWLADHSRSISSLKGVTHYTKLPAALEGGAL
ncbi:hypothetical protein AF48_02752 [Klebsiella aerogenes MGH 62]|uniref:hypothetical protein n=1 Tax=Klebsiella aerogenes TaxID=548 RepID=UPI0004A05DBD|nr:hypothetical protein AF48_02752 [Klebsiella aerogenes MGH 62]